MRSKKFQLGYRPTALILFSGIWFSTGFGLISRPFEPDTLHKLPLEYLPIWFRIGLWWLAALAGIIAAFWPPGKDRWGWVFLSIPATFRAVSYFGASMIGWIDATYAMSWVTIVLVLVLLAFWPEPVKEQ